MALEILTETGRGRRLDVAFGAAGAGAMKERAWIRELVYGTVRLQGRLDHLLARRVRKGLKSLTADVLNIMRLGSYQILYMGGVPPYAAVSQAVFHARARAGRGASGLVNAVLRRVAAEGIPESLFPDPAVDPVGYLTKWGSHPQWMIERWVEAFGITGAKAIVESNNQIPDVFLRPVGGSPEEALSLLTKAGLGASAVEGSVVVRLDRGVDPAKALEVIPSVIQDPAAAWIPNYASPPEDGIVLDLCAAPGGKALALSSMAKAVIACDLSEIRLKLIVSGVERLSANVHVVAADGGNPPFQGADLVLVDAPCSGTGTLRRHPDGRWRVQPGDFKQMVAVQRRILEGAAGLVPPGGLLVYATCTLEREENRDQALRFMSDHPEFVLEPGPVPLELLEEDGFLEVLPQHTGFDGAFAARFRRVG